MRVKWKMGIKVPLFPRFMSLHIVDVGGLSVRFVISVGRIPGLVIDMTSFQPFGLDVISAHRTLIKSAAV